MDRYGEGGVVAELESEIATLLKKPAAAFVPSGTMAQQTTLRVHKDRSGRSSFVYHPTCHMDLREGRGYERLHGLSGRPIGDPRRPLSHRDLEAIGEPPAALLIELPQRHLGGHLPEWSELEAQVAWARQRGAAVHLDGARIWEASAGFSRSLAEIAALFDSVYVSFYKGLGSLAGCCVAGDRELVAQVTEWRTRHGGSMPALWPYAASALTCLRRRLPKMPTYLEHARAIATAVSGLEGVEIVPDPPMTSMMHLLIEADLDRFSQACLDLAKTQGIWTWSHISTTDSPTHQKLELAVGDGTLEFSPQEIAELIGHLLKLAH